jgi:hypothetical protein
LDSNKDAPVQVELRGIRIKRVYIKELVPSGNYSKLPIVHALVPACIFHCFGGDWANLVYRIVPELHCVSSQFLTRITVENFPNRFLGVSVKDCHNETTIFGIAVVGKKVNRLTERILQEHTFRITDKDPVSALGQFVAPFYSIARIVVLGRLAIAIIGRDIDVSR